MPAVRTTPRDVLLRVPKVEPYSNSYLPPTARAREEAKKLAAAATADNAIADATSITSTNVPTTAATDASSAAPTTSLASADLTKPDAVADEAQDRRQRGNSPTLPFLDVDRPEDQTVELSKAATSSAGWNSLLVWARRQRGAQWDASTAIWQVDRYSREYYSFCEHPATTDRSNQPTGTTQEAQGNKLYVPEAEEDDEDDKGPTRVSARSREEGNASPPPVALGRSARLLRR